MNIQDKTSKALASTIVAFRVFGTFKEEAKEAMIELDRRQTQGDSFDYENYISEQLEALPKTALNEGLMKMLSNIANIGSAREK